MNRGVDYSFARPGAAAIKGAGYNFVCRYLASDSGKRITADEVADFQSNNLAIVLVFEDNANQALNGNSQGVRDAQEAQAQADAIGFPSDRPIYFAVDFDARDEQQTQIDDYLRGAASVLTPDRVGVYGGFYVIKRCSENGTAKWFWQTLAWSGGQQFDGNHLYQNGESDFGGGTDVNEAKQIDYGQWPEGVEMSDIATEEDVNDLTVGMSNLEASSNPNFENNVGRPLRDVIKEVLNYPTSQDFRLRASSYEADQKKIADLEAQLATGMPPSTPIPDDQIPPADPSPAPIPSPTPVPIHPITILVLAVAAAVIGGFIAWLRST